jgi:2-polyprenyl-3-methyl-5-hydroxy-6-metoxy-1,4-benzoquinol methylase
MSTHFTTEIASAEIPSDNPVHQRLLYAYIAAKDFVKGDLLEIGCGDGRGVEVLHPLVSTYTAIDKNDILIDILGKKYPDIKFISQFIPPLSMIADNTFDTIVTFQVIEHIENDDLFIKEIHRVLKPGGRALISTVNKKFSLSRNPWHVREYYADGLKKHLGKYFTNIDTKGVHGNEKVMAYYEENKASVKRITRWDIFGMQWWMPRVILRIPYDILNRLNRKKIMDANNTLVSDIVVEDYYLNENPEASLDLFYIVTK